VASFASHAGLRQWFLISFAKYVKAGFWPAVALLRTRRPVSSATAVFAYGSLLIAGVPSSEERLGNA